MTPAPRFTENGKVRTRINTQSGADFRTKREEVKAGSEKSEVCHAEAFPQEGDGRFCWLRTGHFLL
jgi:hypothetical protein